MAQAINTYDGSLVPVPTSFQQIVNPTVPTFIPNLSVITAGGPVFVAQVTITGQTNGMVRYRDDGPPPSATVGMPYFVGSSFSLPLSSFNACQFIMDAATTSATISIAFYAKAQ